MTLPSFEQLTRGVWVAPYLSATGHRLACAIDTGGKCVAQLPIVSDETLVAAQLWAILNHMDPKSED